MVTKKKSGSVIIALPADVGILPGLALKIGHIRSPHQAGFRSKKTKTKKLLLVFSNYQRPVAVDALEENSTVTAVQSRVPTTRGSLSTQNCRPPTKGVTFTQNCPESASNDLPNIQNVLIHHAQCQSEQPLYSSDFALCGFWLPPILKNRLAARKRSSTRGPQQTCRFVAEKPFHSDYHTKRLSLIG